jgi:lysophospholipase L1-like esterase
MGLAYILVLSMMFLACEKSDNRRMAETFAAMKAKGEATVVLIGDSLSGAEFTASGTSWGFFLKSRLAEMLGIRISFINSSRPDETFNRAIRHLQEDVFSFRPDAVIVMLGMNDTAEPNLDIDGFRFITERFFSMLRNEGVFAVVLTTTGYRDVFPGEESYELLREFNDTLSLQARLQHFPVIDLAQIMDELRSKEPERYRSLFVDTVHLNEKGQEFVAEIVCDTIRVIVEREK